MKSSEKERNFNFNTSIYSNNCSDIWQHMDQK